MVARTASMPTPRPEMSETFSAVESPGWKISAATSSGGRSSARSATDDAGLDGARAQRFEVDAGAVVAHRDVDHVPARGARRRRCGPSRACPPRAAPRASRCRGRRRCGTGAPADRSRRSRIERSSSISALRISTSTRLPAALRDLARHARQRLDDAQQRRGAQLEGASLQVADGAVHAVERRPRARGGAAAFGRGGGAQLARAQDHLADGAEEAVEGLGADAQRTAAAAAASRLAGIRAGDAARRRQPRLRRTQGFFFWRRVQVGGAARGVRSARRPSRARSRRAARRRSRAPRATMRFEHLEARGTAAATSSPEPARRRRGSPPCDLRAGGRLR